MYDIVKVDLLSTKNTYIADCFRLDNELTKLHIDIYKKYTNHPLPGISNSIKEFKQFLLQHGKQLYAFIDTETHMVIGCAILKYNIIVKSKVCDINSLIIDSDFKKSRKGLGTEFLNKITNVAKLDGCAYLQLRCAVDNSTALRFYRKQGYVSLTNTLYIYNISKFISPIGYKSITMEFDKLNKVDKDRIKTIISDYIGNNNKYNKLRITKASRITDMLNTLSTNASNTIVYRGKHIGLYNFFYKTNKMSLCHLLLLIMNKQITDKSDIKKAIVHVLKNIYRQTRASGLFHDISADDTVYNEIFNELGFKPVSCIMYKTL